MNKLKDMEIEVKQLINENEMLSHVFLGCIDPEQLMEIKEKYIGERDWQKESAKIPVEMKIGGIPVNPKAFFDTWQDQMEHMIKKEAKKLFSEKIGSQKIAEFQETLYGFEAIIQEWEKKIHWEAENPFQEAKEKLWVPTTPEQIESMAKKYFTNKYPLIDLDNDDDKSEINWWDMMEFLQYILSKYNNK